MTCCLHLEVRGRPKPAPLVAAPLVRTDRSALVASGDLALALSGDLVEGRVGNLVGLNLRRSLNHGREVLQHFGIGVAAIGVRVLFPIPQTDGDGKRTDRKSTRLNSSHLVISYAVFCLKKKNQLPNKT